MPRSERPFAAALDERVKVIAPAASVSALRHKIFPGDVEQVFVVMLSMGIDHPDLIGLLVCPRPVFIVANTKDIWPLSSTEYAHDEARRFYELLGRGDCIKMKVWDRGHEYRDDQLAEAVQWFNTFLKDDPEAAVVEDEEAVGAIQPEALLVCEGGNVHSARVPSASVAYWRVLKTPVCGERDLGGFLDYLRARVVVPDRVEWAEMDTFDSGDGAGRRICYMPEDGILLPVEVLIPPNARDVVILLDESDRRSDLDWQLGVAAQGSIVVRPDLRGWGETANEEQWADWEGWALNLHASKRYRLHALALITGGSIVLDRVRDALSLIPIIEQLAPGKAIAIHGRRGGAWIALLAGLADRRIAGLILERYLASFRDVMDCDMPIQSPDAYLPNLLTWGVDVPDLIEAFDRELTAEEPLSARMRPVPLERQRRLTCEQGL